VTWVGFFLGGWGSLFTAYVVLQTWAALKLRGRRRLLVLLPVLPMAIVVALTLAAYMQESNLWPILMILVSPIACIFVILVWALSRRMSSEPAA
jgi:hypothetical protein